MFLVGKGEYGGTLMPFQKVLSAWNEVELGRIGKLYLGVEATRTGKELLR